MKLGIVAFANNSGLGNQTRRLVKMLKPFRILLIDARPFSKNKQYNPQWYNGFNGYIVNGFPNNREINVFLQGLTHVLVCESPLNYFLFDRARQLKIKTYCQSNYEFCDNLCQPHLALPDFFLMPSYWHLEDMKERFGDNRVLYLPPPLFMEDFEANRNINLARNEKKLRLLHLVGTLASNDRNGTLSVLESIKAMKSDFELVLRSQHELPKEYIVNDPRVSYAIGNVDNEADLYKDFDALVLPRRYAGLCLPMNEALASGLPVIMTDISPNNRALPKEWLIDSSKKGQFMTRTMIDIYNADSRHLAKKIDWLCNTDLKKEKEKAIEIAYNNYSDKALLEKYNNIWTL